MGQDFGRCDCDSDNEEEHSCNGRKIRLLSPVRYPRTPLRIQQDTEPETSISNQQHRDSVEGSTFKSKDDLQSSPSTSSSPLPYAQSPCSPTIHSIYDSMKRTLSLIPPSPPDSKSKDDANGNSDVDESYSRTVSLVMSVSASVDVELAEESKVNQVESSVSSSLSLPSPTLVRKKTWVHPYRSEREMLDDEAIHKLIGRHRTPQRVIKVLGDPASFDFPEQNPALFHLERDLRKIKVSLLDLGSSPEDSQQRRFAKMAILKHYKLLTAIYRRYCKIGCDLEWMTLRGWTSLLRDCGLVDSTSSSLSSISQKKKYGDIFRKTYCYHQHYLHSQRHAKNESLSKLYGEMPIQDTDPWTGIWILQKDKKRLITRSRSSSRAALPVPDEVDCYKFRKMGDLKVIGCLNTMDEAVIGGSLKDTNYRTATLQIAFRPQQRLRITVPKHRRMWRCTLHPPQHVLDPLTMEVEWEEEDAGFSVKRGRFKLFKHSDLEDDDEELPLTRYLGLCRHEFLDALLCVARLSDGDRGRTKSGGSKPRELYRLFDELARDRLNAFVYRNIVDLEQCLNVESGEIEKQIKLKLRASNVTLMKVFRKYAALHDANDCELTEEQWCAMAAELCDAAERYQRALWKKGGRPTMEEIIQCFVLCKSEDQLLFEEEIPFVAFQRCLLYFAASIFRHRPQAKYSVLPIRKRVDAVLKWCAKLDIQKFKVYGGLILSESFRNIHRKNEMEHAADSGFQKSKSMSPRMRSLRCSSLMRVSL